MQCQLDTGSSCNIIFVKDYEKLVSDHSPNLKPNHIKLKCYDNSITKPIGQKILQCNLHNKKYELLFQVVETDIHQKPLLSAETCEMLGFISVNANFCHLQHDRPKSTVWKKGKILKDYNDVFKSLGTLQGEYHIEENRDPIPVKHAPRRVPIPFRDKLADKLAELEVKGIINKKTDPADWISSMELVKRTDKMRICLDPKDLNALLKHSHYQIPTIDEILPNLAKAKIFSS